MKSSANFKTRTDPNGVTHEYEYDASGRIVLDKAQSTGGSVDEFATIIRYQYDDFGLLKSAWSLNANETTVNAVDRAYGSYNELIVEGQRHNGTPGQFLDFGDNLNRYNGEASSIPAVGSASAFGAIAYYYDYPSLTQKLHRLNTVWYPGGKPTSKRQQLRCRLLDLKRFPDLRDEGYSQDECLLRLQF